MFNEHCQRLVFKVYIVCSVISLLRDVKLDRIVNLEYLYSILVICIIKAR